jgi:hypothetical protein
LALEVRADAHAGLVRVFELPPTLFDQLPPRKAGDNPRTDCQFRSRAALALLCVRQRRQPRLECVSAIRGRK